MERQRVAGEALGTADLIGVAVDGADANAQVFQVRDGVLAERQGFYLDNQAERDEAEVTEEFLAQYYSAAPAVPRLVVVGPALRDRAALIAEALELAPRRPGRGSRRRARRQAPAARAGRAQREARRSPRTGCAASAGASSGSTRSPRCRRRSGWTRCRVRIEGFDVSNLGPEHTVASMVVFEGGAPKKADYRRFEIRGDRAERPRRLLLHRGGAVAAHGAATPSRPTSRRTTPSATRASRRSPT